MTESEIEELLGAYALDAIEASERAEIEAHLVTCPRCRAEVASYQEVATLIANSGADAPDAIWTRIADEIAPTESVTNGAERLIAQLPVARRHDHRRRSAFYGAGIAAAAAVAVVIALLSVQISHLNGQVKAQGVGQSGIAAAVSTTLAHQHRSIYLTSASTRLSASVAIAPGGNGYWLSSNLSTLKSSKTYQLWALERGGKVVSLGVLGPNPRSYSAFRISANMQRLMVSVEPEGGTVTPTTPVLIAAPV